VAQVFTADELTVSDKPLTEEDRERILSQNVHGIKRSQICVRHNTMLVDGVCRRCYWEKNPKRRAKEPYRPERPEQVKVTPAGAVEV
jgi:hypothetical protein